MPTAYCFKCRQKREIKDPKQVTLKNEKQRKLRIVPPVKQRE